MINVTKEYAYVEVYSWVYALNFHFYKDEALMFNSCPIRWTANLLPISLTPLPLKNHPLSQYRYLDQ